MTQPMSAAPTPESELVAPAQPIARAGREVLERVMLQLSRLPARVDRGPLLAALGRALSALGQLDRSGIDDGDHLDLLRAAVAAAGRAHGEMSVAEPADDPARLSASLADVFDALSGVVEPTIDRIVTRQDKVLRRRAETPQHKPELVPFQACAGVPRLVTLEREPLAPLLRVTPDADVAEKEDDAEDSEEEDEGDDNPTDPPPAPEEGEPEPSLERELWVGSDDDASPEEAELRGLRRLARDAVEELGSLGLLRAPNGPDGAWAVGPAAFEERLLKNLDAFMGLAEPFASRAGEGRLDVLAVLLDWAGDAMVPDPARAFARALVLGCVTGEDTARAAVMALRQSHMITYDAQGDALALAPHAGIVPLLERMLGDERPPLVRVALSVLERRRHASFEVVAPLISHPNAGVRAAAAKCLSVATSPQAALRLLEEHAGSEENDAVRVAAAESLLILGSHKGLAMVREKLAEEVAFAGSLSRTVRIDCLRLLAIAGGPSDAELLMASLGHDPSAALALGWFGDAALVPALLGALSQAAGIPARAGFAQALTRALHRITGLGRTPQTDPKTSLYVLDPALDVGFWMRAWEEKKETFTEGKRYRFGMAFSPLLTIAEAAEPEVSTSVRRDLLLELSIVSRGASRAHVSDWVARQKLALSEMKELFSRGPLRLKAPYPEGRWARSVLFE